MQFVDRARETGRIYIVWPIDVLQSLFQAQLARHVNFLDRAIMGGFDSYSKCVCGQKPFWLSIRNNTATWLAVKKGRITKSNLAH